MSIEQLMSLNNEQREAVNIEKNISLSAGAGSGKTRVLTSRFLTLIDSGIDMKEIVAITFTEKAALEMKERVREGIIKLIGIEECEKRRFWQEQLDKLMIANISTIHGFCSNIVKENAALLGSDFKFQMISEIERKRFLREQGNKIIRELLNTEKYNAVKKYILDNYDVKYLRSGLVEDIIKCRENILESGKSIEEVYENSIGILIEEFIMETIIKLHREYGKFKTTDDLMDFTDLQIKALQVLENKEVCSWYKEKYTRFLVDEFQDTNEIQKKIIYKFTTHNRELMSKRLFVVGDLKQSIYGFRGADCSVFEKVSNEIGEEGKKELSICYRSEKEIIFGINEIFKGLIKNYQPLMYKEHSDIKEIKEKRITLVSYDKKESNNKEALENVKKLFKNKSATKEEYREALNNCKKTSNEVEGDVTSEVEAILKSIQLLVDKGLEFKDICVLVRSRGAFLQGIEWELEKCKVPYCIIGGTGYYGKREVQEILNLYEIIVSNFNENLVDNLKLKLVSVLRSPIFHFSDELILRIFNTIYQKEIKFIQACEEIISRAVIEEDDTEKIEKALRVIRALDKEIENLSPGELIKYIVNICSINDIYMTQIYGVKKIRNIEKLVNIAENYDKSEFGTHERFISYVSEEMDNNYGENEASLDNEQSNAVKIMTIHASKGLEFEGVIVPKMNQGILRNTQTEFGRIKFLYDEDRIAYKKDLYGEDTERFEQIKGKKQESVLEEEIRVLYVAMTRAKQYIVLTGEKMINEINKPQKEMSTKLSTFNKLLAYSLNNGRGKEFVEIVNADELKEIEVQQNDMMEVEFNKDSISNNLEAKYECRPQFYASASMYMKHNGCPRRYYYDNVMRIPYEIVNEVTDKKTKLLEYDEKVFEEKELEEEKQEVKMPLYASARGTIAHSAIEHLENNGEGQIEQYLVSKVEEYFLEDNNSDEVKNQKNEIKEIILGYIDNYKKLRDEDMEKHNEYNLVYKENEAFYLISPIEDRKMIVPGYIDHLKVYEKDDKYKAEIIDYKTNKVGSSEDIEHFKEQYYTQLLIYGKAIKDLLHINGKKIDEIELTLYFLDNCELVELEYKEELADELMRKMNETFKKVKSLKKIHNFPCKVVEECIRCNYKSVCK